MKWDPAQYAKYSDERSRPFFDLTGQIGAERPDTVLDLGCGSGELTATLTERWPEADIRGMDSSPEMISATVAGGSVTFEVGRAEEFDATGVDVLVSNALLQWVPTHRVLLQKWAAELNPGGWLAFQVPSNFGAPSHALMRSLASTPRWLDKLSGVLRGTESVASPESYLDLLTGAGLATTVWQTEYLHVLQGDNPVLEWVRGTGLRPVLAALSAPEAEEFSAEYAALLRDAYPTKPYGTVFGFLRTFVVGRKLNDRAQPQPGGGR